MDTIGKIIATEKQPSTIEEFTFWTRKDLKLKPFDVVVVEHVENSKTYGVVEEISHMTDSPSALAGYISSDFGDVEALAYTERISMNYVKCKVVGNDKNVYIPVQEGRKVFLASREEIMEALGLNDVKNFGVSFHCYMIYMYVCLFEFGILYLLFLLAIVALNYTILLVNDVEHRVHRFIVGNAFGVSAADDVS